MENSTYKKAYLGVCKKAYLAMRRAFWYGFFVSTGIHMWVQDWLGLEKYLAYVREHWINFHWMVGGGIALFCIWAYCGMLWRFGPLNKDHKDDLVS